MKIYSKNLTLENLKEEYLAKRTNAMLESLIGTDHCSTRTWWNSQNAGMSFNRPCDCKIQDVYNYVLKYYKKGQP
jgi:hypothetical protein